jgi:hypothetical protein
MSWGCNAEGGLVDVMLKGGMLMPAG